MSFPSDVVIQDATPADVTYSTISMADKKSIRSDSSRELGTPRLLTLSHQTVGKNLSAMDRHLIRLDRIEPDPDVDSVATVQGSVYAVIENPRRVITKTQIHDMVTQLKNFLTTSNVDKVLNGEP